MRDCLQLYHAEADKAKLTWPTNKEIHHQIKNILTIITYYPMIQCFLKATIFIERTVINEDAT